MPDSKTPDAPEDPSQDSEEVRRARDDARCHAVVQTMKDILWRFDESSEGNYTIYDVLSYLTEDLVSEGCCAACIQESIGAAFEQAGADALEHKPDDTAVLH